MPVSSTALEEQRLALAMPYAKDLKERHGDDVASIAAELMVFPSWLTQSLREVIWLRVHSELDLPPPSHPLVPPTVPTLPFNLAPNVVKVSSSARPRSLPTGFETVLPSAYSPFTPRAPAQPVVPGPHTAPPTHLNIACDMHVYALRSAPLEPAPLAPGRLRVFEGLREQRTTAARDVAAPGVAPRERWRDPNNEDVAFGPWSEDCGRSVRAGAYQPRKLEWMSLTTFAVGPAGSNIVDAFKPSSTALKMNEISDLLLGAPVAMAGGWIDSNPCPRPAQDGTKADDTTQFALHKFSSRIVDFFAPKVLVVMQAANRAWILSRIAPLWVKKSMPTIDEASFYMPPEAFDPYWIFGGLENDLKDEQPKGARKITAREQQLYLWTHVMDVSSKLPAGPLALFIEKYHGKYNTIIMFAPHPCNVDPLRYARGNAKSACDELERCYRSIAWLFSDRREEFERRPSYKLERFYGGELLGSAYLSTRKFPLGTLDSLIALRGEEQRTGLALDLALSYSLRALASRHLCGSDDPDAILSQAPSPFPSSHPPSILHDLLRHIRSLRLDGLAKRERAALEEAHGGAPLSERDCAVLEEAYASPEWRSRMAALGVEAGFIMQKRMFTRGEQLSVRRPPPQDAVTRRKEALSQAGESAALYWSQHFENGNDLRLWLRLCSITTQRPGTVYCGKSRVSVVNACSSCAARGLPTCAIPLESAVAAGYVFNYHSYGELIDELEAWDTALHQQRRFGRRAAVKQQLERALESAHELDMPTLGPSTAG